VIGTCPTRATTWLDCAARPDAVFAPCIAIVDEPCPETPPHAASHIDNSGNIAKGQCDRANMPRTLDHDEIHFLAVSNART
jgi:hypothetical protein